MTLNLRGERALLIPGAESDPDIPCASEMVERIPGFPFHAAFGAFFATRECISFIPDETDN